MNTIFNKLVEMAQSFGGKAYLVGGAVRDELINVPSKDYDFLITKISLEDLAKKLQNVFPTAKVNEVGQSFGVVKLSLEEYDFDFAIPRADIDRENVKTDPNIPVEQDLMRRDFTIGALAKDLETGHIVSPEGHDGVYDIKNKIVRAVGNPKDRFREDPLRILRGCQFAARFGFTIEPNTLQAIKENVNLLKNVSIERFYEEFKKAWTKGNTDTEIFFKLLEETKIGVTIFGDDFQPISLNPESIRSEDGFTLQSIACFLKGGDYTRLLLKSNEQDVIRVSHWFKGKQTPDYKSIKTIYKFGKYFQLIVNAFSLIDNKTGSCLASLMKNLITKPLIPKIECSTSYTWECPIGGGELMDIANDLRVDLKGGKEISNIILKLIMAYQNGTLVSHIDKDENKEIIKQFLKNREIIDK